jgi:hypothetical protein
MRETVYRYPLVDVITILEMRGYVVRHKSVLSFGRTHPFPRGVDFKQEALERIRQRITLNDLKFKTRMTPDMAPDLPDTITTATLRVF